MKAALTLWLAITDHCRFLCVDPVNVTPHRTGPQAARRSAEADSRLALEETNQLRATILSRMASSCYQGNFVAAGQPAGHVVGTTPVTWLTYPSPPPSPMGHTATSLPPPREGQNDKAAYNLDESKQRFPDATVPLWRPWWWWRVYIAWW